MPRLRTARLPVVLAASNPTEDKFNEFARTFNRTYSSLKERASKLAVFAENLVHIERLQMQEEGPAKYSYLTPFADISPEEFSQRHGFRASDWRPSFASAVEAADLPESFDWRA